MIIVWRKRDRRARREIAASDVHSGRDFTRARLVGMDLRNKRFDGANFEWADLTDADLRGADLSVANLHGAYLTGAQLDGVNLGSARLDDAYLLATDFGNARLEGATLIGAVWDQGTSWPPGYGPPRNHVGLRHGRKD